MRCTGEMLRGIQSVKAMAWEPVFLDRILAAREKELEALGVRREREGSKGAPLAFRAVRPRDSRERNGCPEE